MKFETLKTLTEQATDIALAAKAEFAAVHPTGHIHKATLYGMAHDFLLGHEGCSYELLKQCFIEAAGLSAQACKALDSDDGGHTFQRILYSRIGVK